MTRVAHLSSVHPAFDNRIFHKECVALAKAGYDVVLIVPHVRNEVMDGVRIRALPRPGGRIQRVTRTLWQVYRAALAEKADVYHFHDPELIPVGILLRMAGKRVIYDVHEDYVTSIAQKGYLPHILRKPLAATVATLEHAASRWFAIILAEKYYLERFPNGTTILNYPVLDRARAVPPAPAARPDRPRLLYTGNVTPDRGAELHAGLVNLLPDAEVFLIGRCDEALAAHLRRIAGANVGRLHIEGVGEFVPRSRIEQYYARGGWTAGLAVFPPTPHYLRKELTKLFEYMGAGIPVIASNFPLWQGLISDAGCGVVVDPHDPAAIRRAVKRLLCDPAEAEAMGRRGCQAVQMRYNWQREAERLIAVYRNLSRR